MYREEEYGLIRAKGRQNGNDLSIMPIELEKVIYGRMPTKRGDY
jgi:hypothetical protein